MADSRDWENRTGSESERGTETTKTTIITERSRAGQDERRHTLDTSRTGADERRHAGSAGVKSYPAEYASGMSGSDEPGRGATVRGGEDMGSGRYGEGSGGRFEEQSGGPSMDRRPGESARNVTGQSGSFQSGEGRTDYREPREGRMEYGQQHGQRSGSGEQQPYGEDQYGQQRQESRQFQGGKPDYREQAAQTGAQMKDTATRMAEEARQRGKGFLEEQKGTAADSLERFASILHETGERLEDDQPTFSQFFHSGADSLDRFAGILRERDTESMFNEFQDFARRQPGLLLGGAVAAGFFLSRMLKSSSHRSESEYMGHTSRRSGQEEEFFSTSDRMRAYREVGQDVPSTTTMEDYHARE